jgi:hypothetical protein
MLAIDNIHSEMQDGPIRFCSDLINNRARMQMRQIVRLFFVLESFPIHW